MGVTYDSSEFLQQAHEEAMKGSTEQMAIFFQAVQDWAGGFSSEKIAERFQDEVMKASGGPQLAPCSLAVDLQDEVF
jgi:hypothetical protein